MRFFSFSHAALRAGLFLRSLAVAGPLLSDDPAVGQLDDPRSVRGVFLGVRYLDDGGPFLIEPLKQVHDLLALAGVRLPVGSSARITLGLAMIARATATSCCWPPDNCVGYRSFLPTI